MTKTKSYSEKKSEWATTIDSNLLSNVSGASVVYCVSNIHMENVILDKAAMEIHYIRSVTGLTNIHPYHYRHMHTCVCVHESNVLLFPSWIFLLAPWNVWTVDWQRQHRLHSGVLFAIEHNSTTFFFPAIYTRIA